MASRPASSPASPSTAAQAHLRCLALTAHNPLHDAARRLGPGLRYRLFLAAYAAMRVVDDLVDEGYLAAPAAARAARRDEVRARLALWRRQVEAAARGRYEPRSGDLEPLVFTALAPVLGASDLGPDCFLRLAAVLEEDLGEAPLVGWDDFLAYCEGAAVAPGAVFLYLLGGREDGAGGLRWALPRSCVDLARPLARYCYLIHIVRDLAEDAARHPRLLTVPHRWIEEAGLTVQAFRAAAAHGDHAAVAPVARRLLAAATEEDGRWRSERSLLAAALPVDRRAILDYLYGLYRATFEEVGRRYQEGGG